jgi:hypothetical protein
MVGSCEYGNATSGSIKDGEFLEQLSDYQLLKKNSAPRITISLRGGWYV